MKRSAVFLLASAMLDMAADRFADHGCNDYMIPQEVSDADARQLVSEEILRNGDRLEMEDFGEVCHADMDRVRGWLGDYRIMLLCADALRKMAKEADS